MEDPGGDGPSKARAEEAAALATELIEALTALGNYLEAAKQVSTLQSDQARRTLCTALERSEEQFQRAVEAVRTLRNVLGGRITRDR